MHRKAKTTVAVLETRLETISSMLRLQIDDLNKIRSLYEDVWEPRMEVQLLGAELNMYGLAFQRLQRAYTESDQHAKPFMQGDNVAGLLLSGLNTALSVIGSFSAVQDALLTEARAKQDPHLATCLAGLPKHLKTLTIYAACFVFNVILHHGALTPSDRTHAWSQIQTARNLVQAMSVRPGDDAAKAAERLGCLMMIESHPEAVAQLKLGKSKGLTSVALLDDTMKVISDVSKTDCDVADDDLAAPDLDPSGAFRIDDTSMWTDFPIDLERPDNLDWTLPYMLDFSGLDNV